MKQAIYHKRTAVRIVVVTTLMLTILFLVAGDSGLGQDDNPTAADTTDNKFEFGDPKHLVLMVVYAVVALVFSFLCSVAEAVMLSISPSYVAGLEQNKSSAAGRLKKLKNNIDRSLAAILTLNTIAHTVGAGGAGAEAAGYFGKNYVGIAMAVLTLLILFLSEIIPKTIGAVYWRSLAPLTGRFVQWLIWILCPLIFVSELLTKLLTRGKSVHDFNRDEFAALADVGVAAGHIDSNESRILKNLFRFSSVRAEDIMTPRTVVFALQEDRKICEFFDDQQPEITFSRIPVYGENRDDITGFVLKNDILLDQAHNDGNSTLKQIKREIRAVREDTSLSHVLENLLDNRSHTILVVDEYGGLQGIVTLEDAVETLIGIEIVDEKDKTVDMRALARQKWEQRMRQVGIDLGSKGEADDC